MSAGDAASSTRRLLGINMTVNISLAPLALLGGEEGHLILVDDKLAAVVSRLDDENYPAEHQGRWFIEAGFGPCAPTSHERLFQTLDQAARWVARRASNRSDHCCGGCSG